MFGEPSPSIKDGLNGFAEEVLFLWISFAFVVFVLVVILVFVAEGQDHNVFRRPLKP
jgi:hypothetical protein